MGERRHRSGFGLEFAGRERLARIGSFCRDGSGRRTIPRTDVSRRSPRRSCWHTRRPSPPPAIPRMAAIDGDSQTGWGFFGGAGRPFLILRFAEPLRTGADSTLVLRLHQDSKYRRATLGRFRIALSSGTPLWPDPPSGEVAKALEAASATSPRATEGRLAGARFGGARTCGGKAARPSNPT